MALQNRSGVSPQFVCALCGSISPECAIHVFDIVARRDNRRDWVYSCLMCRPMVDRVVGRMMAENSALVLHVVKLPQAVAR